MKKLIAFDLDGTLADSKSPAEDRMTELLARLLDKFEVCVISGGKFDQFRKQLLGNMEATPSQLEKLHIMPTCGTRYYQYDMGRAAKNDGWYEVYAENFTEPEKKKIFDALNKGFDDLGMRAKKIYGECIEDRGSQVTFSVMGQDIVDELGKEGVRTEGSLGPRQQEKEQTARLHPAIDTGIRSARRRRYIHRRDQEGHRQGIRHEEADGNAGNRQGRHPVHRRPPGSPAAMIIRSKPSVSTASKSHTGRRRPWPSTPSCTSSDGLVADMTFLPSVTTCQHVARRF